MRKLVGPDQYIKIGLQLYQVDQKSYLLDFRNFDATPEEAKKTQDNNSKGITHHNVMEFFELCAGLIGSLAR